MTSGSTQRYIGNYERKEKYITWNVALSFEFLKSQYYTFLKLIIFNQGEKIYILKTNYLEKAQRARAQALQIWIYQYPGLHGPSGIKKKDQLHDVEKDLVCWQQYL